MIVYSNLKAIISGSGFRKKDGRNIVADDLGIIKGPVHIVCDDKKIKQITKSIPSGAKVLDCTDLVASAAFIDSHTHALFGGSRWQEFFNRWSGKSYTEIAKAGGGIVKTFADTKNASDTELLESLIKNLNIIARSGVRVLEVKSGYGATLDEEMRILRLLKKAHHPLVQIKPTFLGLHAIPKGMDEKSWTDQMIEALVVVKKENLALFVDAFPEIGFFSIAQTKRFFENAQKLGFGLKLHADEITDMNASQLCLDMNGLSIDHLQKISQSAIEKLGTSKTVATLLPATSFYLGIDYAPARKILKGGAKVALATDFNPGTAPEPSILFTAKLAASQFRMTASEILCALTYNAASALACEIEWGSIEAGFNSNILFWQCDSDDYAEEIVLAGKHPVTMVPDSNRPE